MSKFKALFEEANQDEEQSNSKKAEEKAIKTSKRDESNPFTKKSKGKRSDPDYTGVFAYVPRKLHEDTMIKLIRRKDLDFSGLVEQLLYKWNKEEK